MKFIQALIGSFLTLTLLVQTEKANSARPITQGHWGIGLHAGVAPHFFTRKAGFTSILDAFDANGNYTYDFFIKQRHFSSHFGAPVTGRAEITYAIMADLEAFVDADYVFAQGQTIKILRKHFPSDTGPIVDIRMKNQSLHEVGLHLGLRHYTDLGTNLSPFLGCKFGGRYHNNVNIYHVYDKQKVTTTRFLRGGVSFSAGAEIGFDYKVTDNYSIILKGEILGITSYREPQWLSTYKKDGTRSRIYSSNHVRKQYGTDGKPSKPLNLTTLMPFRAAISLPITLGMKLHL
jgi:hypothetical protein